MFGWRARLGFLLPVDNAVLEPELAASPAVAGVSHHVVRLTTTDRASMPANGVELAGLFHELGVDVIGYACAETSFLGEVDVNRWIQDTVEAAVGVPTVTASAAMLSALDSLGIRRVALASPYPSSSADALVGLLGRHGVEVVSAANEDLVTAARGVREWASTNEQPPAKAAELARRADVAEADAVLVSATNLRTLSVLASLEQDLGKPVVSSNSALLWAMLHAAGVREVPPRLGALAGRRP
jgi:maleate isomerase